MPRSFCVLAVVAAGLFAGCGGDAPKQVPTDQVRQTELAELGEMLKTLAADNKKPPRKVAELAELEPLLPTAGPGLHNGEVVYFWGAGYVAGGQQVVAHEKNTPTGGGWVLLQDGTVKQMTAAEFTAAPKAK